MIREVRIDERSWNDATPERRLEWSALIAELLARWNGEEESAPKTLRISRTEEATVLELIDPAGTRHASVRIPKEALASVIAEYVDTVRQMSLHEHSRNSPRLEALDMAKKVVHDKAARILAHLVAPLGANRAACRSLFTLLLALRVDTSRLLGVHCHRPIR